MSINILNKIKNTRKLWIEGLKKKNIKQILNCYDKNFVFKGTFENKPTNCIYDLSKYFKKLILNFDEVIFLKTGELDKQDKKILIQFGKYNFKNKYEIVNASYSMVFNEKGKIISHHSNFIKKKERK